MKKEIIYKGIKLVEGISSRPHSNLPITSHDIEYDLFQGILNNVENQTNPVMIEIGPWWAFWSLCFRKKFPNGKNILVELGKRQLSIGIENFKLNEFSETHYWGGVFLENSNTYSNIKSNYEYDKVDGEYFDDLLLGKMVGPEINFVDIYSIEKLDVVDLLHMDIQGSELPLIQDLYLNYRFILEEKIKNIIIATHSVDIHNSVKEIINNCGFNITKDAKFGEIGGDGMIIATKK